MKKEVKITEQDYKGGHFTLTWYLEELGEDLRARVERAMRGNQKELSKQEAALHGLVKVCWEAT
jgi:hypothetical protein